MTDLISKLATTYCNPFHKEFMSLWSKSCKNMGCFCMQKTDPNRSQFCTCHNSLAVVTCAKLSVDWTIKIKVRTDTIFSRFQLWARKHFVKWIPGPAARDDWQLIMKLTFYFSSPQSLTRFVKMNSKRLPLHLVKTYNASVVPRNFWNKKVIHCNICQNLYFAFSSANTLGSDPYDLHFTDKVSKL